MKTLKTIFKNTFLVVIATTSLFSCSKNDEATPEPDKPITVNTIAGSTPGDFDAMGTNAKLQAPFFSVQDPQGNIYFTELANHKIKKITPAGAVSTFAGTGVAGSDNGSALLATFNQPRGIAIDNLGNLYVTDLGSHKIRKITPQGLVSTFAGSTQGDQDVVEAVGSTALTAKFDSPYGICVDNSGNILVCDYTNSKIKKINPSGTAVSTFVGTTYGDVDGNALTAKINPTSITKDSQGNFYFTELNNNKIKKLTSAGVVTTIAGSTLGDIDDTGTAAKFNSPTGITTDNSGTLYVSDTYNHKIKKLTSAGVVTTIAGNNTTGDVDGLATAARFNLPIGIMVDASGSLIFCDANNHKIKKVTLK